MSSARLLMEKLNSFRNRGSSSSTSPPLPPVDPEHSRVKRALFGPVDHEENRRFVKKELERTQRIASEKWNFDFGSDTPLQGRFQWETVRVPLIGGSKPSVTANVPSPTEPGANDENKISSTSSLPSSLSSSRTTSPAPKERSDTNSNNLETENSSPALDPSAPRSSTSTASTFKSNSSSSTATSKERICDNTSQRASRSSRHQTTVTDYFRTRKRSKSKVKLQERKQLESRRDLLQKSSESNKESTTSSSTSSSNSLSVHKKSEKSAA